MYNQLRRQEKKAAAGVDCKHDTENSRAKAIQISGAHTLLNDDFS